MQVEELYIGLERLLNDFIRKEWIAQGHHLTGEFERSLEAKYTKTARIDLLSGYAIYYAKIVDEGIEPDKISSKMLPGLIKYFQLRRVPNPEVAAQLTLRKWRAEGMSTQASKRFSSTGARQNFIESAFVGNEYTIDSYMIQGLDFMVDEQYRKTKSETI